MTRLRFIAMWIGVGLLLCSSGCQDNYDNTGVPDAIYQVSLINSLMLGDYDGTVSVEQFLQKGDTGIGTFDELDGEMIVLDGTAYKAKADGSVEAQPGSETVPFGAITFFDSDMGEREIVGISDIE